jgi:DNA-binding transcriptional regulator YdaS (Cro superfamily)
MTKTGATTALERAVRAAGNATRLAEVCGVTPQAVYQWRRKRGKVPVECVLRVEQFTGVPRHELRPDIYPPPILSLAS